MVSPNSSKISMMKKWMPAIILAILIHLIIILFFVSQQKKETQPSFNEAKMRGSDQIAEGQSNATAADVNQVKQTTTPTLTETAPTLTDINSQPDYENTVNANTQATNDLSNTIPTKLTRQTLTKQMETDADDNQTLFDESNEGTLSSQNRALQSKNAFGHSVETINKADSSASPLSPLNKDNKNAVNRLNNSSVIIDQGNPATDFRESSIDTVKNIKNPNEDLLLPRDLPKPSNIESNTTAQYDQTSREIEDINDKLSQTINEVKRQKMQEIEAEKEHQRAIHMQDKATKTSEAVAQVSRQLEVDKLAEAEFGSIANK